MPGEHRTYRNAAEVAPVKVSAGRVAFGMGRFERAITTITPRDEKTFRRKTVPTPAIAIMRPPRAGPTARARLNSIPFRARAGDKSSLRTRSGKVALHAGDSSASPIESAKVSHRPGGKRTVWTRKGSFYRSDCAKSRAIGTRRPGHALLDEVGDIPIEIQPKLLRVIVCRQPDWSMGRVRMAAEPQQ